MKASSCISTISLILVASSLFGPTGAWGFEWQSFSNFDFGAFFGAGSASPAVTPPEPTAVADTIEDTTPTFTVNLQKQDVPVVRNGKVVAQKTAYFGEVHVGSPVQTFTVVFDTGSGHLILPSSTCKSETCAKHRQFQSGASSSAVEIEHSGQPIPTDATSRDQVAITFGTGKVVGEFVKDYACLGKSKEFCVDLRVVLANQMSEEPFGLFNFDGVLGLGLNALTLADEFSFFGQMAIQNPMMQPRFGVFLARHDETSGSSITFGGHDARHVGSEIQWSALAMEELGYWQVQIKALRIGDTVLEDCEDGSCRAILDTGTSLIGVPKQSAQAMHRQLARPVPDELLQTHQSTDCRSVSGLDIHFDLADGITISLGVADYSRQAPINVTVPPQGVETEAQTRQFCRALLLPVDMKAPLGPKVFIWGEPVLRKYYTIYDWGAKKVGFAAAKHPRAVEGGDAAIA